MITVYTGAAFVILSLVDMVREPFELPNWSFKLVVVLLAIGLIIAVILSWIYDIHPEGGLVKTEPAHKVKPEDIPKSSNNWKIASYISFVVIVGLIAMNVFRKPASKEHSPVLETSIAVLPFENMSNNEEDDYLGGAFCDEIIMELQKIKEFDRVLSRTSTMQFEKQRPTIPEIGELLNVNYIVEGSIQRIQDRIRIRVQVLRAKNEDHIWADEYDREWKDIFSIQDDIAFRVAKELQLTLTPEEKDLIEKIPTTSLMANELYQRGREEYIKFLVDVRDKDALMTAQKYYLSALDHDSTFAKACAGVAQTFHNRLDIRGRFFMICSEGYLEDDAFDPVLFWANKALNYDKQLPEAYYSRGLYYFETGNREKAEKDLKTAIRLNPNYWEAYTGLGNLHTGTDLKQTLEYFLKAESLARGPELSYIRTVIIQTYIFSGLFGKAESLNQEYVTMTQDSLIYYLANYWLNLFKHNPEEQHYWLKKAYAYDSTNADVLSFLAERYIEMGNFEEGLKYFKQSYEIDQANGRIPINRLHRIGYGYDKAGYKEEADYYFDRQEEICNRLIDLNRPWAQLGNAQFDLALIYAYRGEKSKAMEILSDLHQRSSTPYVTALYIQRDLMLDGIRDDPEFQQIANDLGIKFQAETERVRQWLEENDMVK